MKKIILKMIFTISLAFVFSCNKGEFLNEKPNTSLLVPTSLSDFQKLLDNSDNMNISGLLGIVGSDDYYLPNRKVWEALPSVSERNGYIWAKDIYQGTENISDWAYPYRQVLYANIVLEGLSKLTPNTINQAEYDRIKGQALFIRGHAFFNLAQHFSEAYDVNTAKQVLGVPIRLEADVAVKSVRANLQQTYDQILSDLMQAAFLLPDKIPGVDRNRPYKVAAQALISRIYLCMRNYDMALKYAETTLAFYSKLMSYSTLSTSSTFPIPVDNPETIYSCLPNITASRLIGISRIAPNTLVNDELYKSYSANDLRKTIFFTNSATYNKPVFRATYDGSTRAFSGIATDELYLIKAECQIRIKNYQDGLATLNQLIRTRYVKDTFVDLNAPNKDAALTIVLLERRKELPFRGLRWSDLRRLNKDGANITLTRTLDGVVYTLPPNSPLYVMPIPPDEIRLSGLEQNVR